jgi:hypothetical protein
MLTTPSTNKAGSQIARFIVGLLEPLACRDATVWAYRARTVRILRSDKHKKSIGPISGIYRFVVKCSSNI